LNLRDELTHQYREAIPRGGWSNAPCIEIPRKSDALCHPFVGRSIRSMLLRSANRARGSMAASERGAADPFMRAQTSPEPR
jgi:hypothetical protein